LFASLSGINGVKMSMKIWQAASSTSTNAYMS
jgi:hypothetical protein